MTTHTVPSVSTDQQRQRRFQAFQLEHAPNHCTLCEQPHRSGGKVCGICRLELLAEVDACWTRFGTLAEYLAARSWAFAL